MQASAGITDKKGTINSAQPPRKPMHRPSLSNNRQSFQPPSLHTYTIRTASLTDTRPSLPSHCDRQVQRAATEVMAQYAVWYTETENNLPKFTCIVFEEATEQFTERLMVGGGEWGQPFTQPQCSNINIGVELHLHTQHTVTHYCMSVDNITLHLHTQHTVTHYCMSVDNITHCLPYRVWLITSLDKICAIS